MTLQVYNSLSQQKEPFKPLQPDTVGLYVCGMTVYDYCHIGHARVFVTFDIITRYLRSRGYKVNYVRNITDIDDKIINRARENKESITALTERFIAAMHEDTEALGVLLPDLEPRATQTIAVIINMIQALIAKGHAYVASNKDVIYRVSSFPGYGQLAHKDLDGLRAGARVELTQNKEEPLDFVLWKHSKPGEPQWDSPWGHGRPGWHIECSAMSTHCLGNHFDMHGGGLDLIFPHHENEIAQSEAATGEKFVNTWMHVGFVQVNKEKMSKSLGNFFTIREVLAKYPAEVIRYFMIASHYRSPINYSPESLAQASGALTRLYTALRGLPASKVPHDGEIAKRFQAVMDDDFNTPEALALLFELAREINSQRETNLHRAAELGALLRQFGAILGILQQDPEAFLQSGVNNEAQIQALIAQRTEARTQKNWAEADRIRQQLLQMGVELEDSSAGTTWRHM